MPSRPHKEQLGKGSSKIGTPQKSKTKKMRKVGKEGTSGMRSKSWRRSWNEEGSLQLNVMQKAPELVVHERMSPGKGVKCLKEKKKVKGWSTEEAKGSPKK